MNNSEYEQKKRIYFRVLLLFIVYKYLYFIDSKIYESWHKCPLENVLGKMSPNFGPQKKCPLDLVLGKMSFEVNVLDKNVL